ncbi:MAG: serine protease [Pseudomonadota bacterium]
MKKINLFAFLLSILTALGCTEEKTKEVPFNDISFYQDSADSQFSGQRTELGVVRIEDGRAFGTGFFVSQDGLMITNNHVLGTGNCVVEGCFVTLTFDYAKNRTPNKVLIFAKPVHIDAVADIAVHQVFQAYYTTSVDGKFSYPKKANSRLLTPHFLEISETSPDDLVDSTVYTVGHPLGGLKKVTPLAVVASNGQDITIGGAVVSGQSGSPVVDDQGKVVGVLKTSSLRFTDLSANQLNVSGGVAAITELGPYFQVNSGVLSQKAGEPAQLSEMNSIKDPTLENNWLRRMRLFQNSQALPASIVGKGIGVVFKELYQRCESYLKNAEDGLISALEKSSEYSISDCYRPLSFYHCDNFLANATDVKRPWSYFYCPTTDEKDKIAQ